MAPNTCHISALSVLLHLLWFAKIVEVQGQADIERNVTISPFGSKGVYAGDTAMFDCTTYEFEAIDWLVNEELINFVDGNLIQNHTLSYSFSGDRKEWRYSTLTFPAKLVQNDTMITCKGSLVNNANAYPLFVNSQFYVQGPPDKVLNFQGTNNRSTSTLQFSWTPPLHIPGISPCCDNYSVNITNVDSGSSVYQNSSYIDTTLTIQVPSEDICSLYQIDIAAFNGLGEGELFTTRWSSGGFFETDEATNTLYYNQVPELNLGVNITIDGYCLNDLDNVTLSVNCSRSDSNILRRTQDIEADSTTTRLQRYINVMIPASHQDDYCFFDVALENKVDLQPKPFSTFDVQEVTATVIPGGVCVTCKYITNSPGQGCVLVVSRAGIDRNVQFLRNISILEEEGCLDSLSLGRYTVRVFDWQADGTQGNNFLFSSIINIETVTNSTSPTRTPSPTSNPTSAAAAAAIGGVSSVLVVLLVAVIVVLIVLMAYTCKKKKVQEMDRMEMDRIECDSRRSPDCSIKIDGSGEPVANYCQVKEKLEQFGVKDWKYQGNHVQFKSGKIPSANLSYKYILITTDDPNDINPHSGVE